MQDANKEAVYNTPLLVNALRFIRNRRLPPGDVYGDGETAPTQFEFAGLCVTDCGPFREAEGVWAEQSLLEGSNTTHHERGSTFAGPLHMLVIVGGVTVEHWKLEDYREEHTENSLLRTHEHLVKLNDLARILYTYLCCGDVYSAIERKANEPLEEEEESPASSSNPRFSSTASGITTPAGVSAARPACSTHVVGGGGVTGGAGRLAYNGTELIVVGAEGGEGNAVLRERGLLHKLNNEGGLPTSPYSHSRYEQQHWYVEELLSMSVIRDTMWGGSQRGGVEGTPPTDVDSRELFSSAPQTTQESAAAPAAVKDKEHTVVAEEDAEGAESPVSQKDVVKGEERRSPSKTGSAGEKEPPAPKWRRDNNGSDAVVNRQALPVFRKNPAGCPHSGINSPGLLPVASNTSSPVGSQVRRPPNSAPSWAGELTRHSTALSNGSMSGTLARLCSGDREEDSSPLAVTASDIYTMCLRLTTAEDTPTVHLSELLRPLRH